MAEEHTGIEGNRSRQFFQDQAVQKHSRSMDISKAPPYDTKNMHSSNFSLQMSLNGNLLEPGTMTIFILFLLSYLSSRY